MFVLFSYCAECRYIFYKMQSQLSPNQLRNTRLCSIHLHDSCVQRLVVPCLPYPSTLLYTGCCSEVKDIVYLCGEASWGHAPYYSSLWGRRLRCVGWGGRHTGQSGKLARSCSLSLSQVMSTADRFLSSKSDSWRQSPATRHCYLTSSREFPGFK